MFDNKNTEMEQRMKKLKVTSPTAVRLAVALLENLANADMITSKTFNAIRRDADKMIAECKALG